MKKSMMKENGITLIALIITVIVLLILAAVSISAIIGKNSFGDKGKEATFKTKMSSIAEELDLYIMGQMVEEESTNLYAGELLKSIIEDEEIEEVDTNEVEDIKTILTKVTETEETYTIVFEGKLYYVSQKNISNNDNQRKWCEEIGIRIWDYTGNTGIKVVNGNYEEVNGVYMCTPKLNQGFSKEHTRYINVREDKLTPGNWINKKPDDDWYDYDGETDEAGNVIKGPTWANLYVENNGIESYYVWIPRYVYKTAENERMDVKFVNLQNTHIEAKTQVQTSWEELQAQGYKLPEAFQWDNDANGTIEAGEELPGYWMSKYQLSDLGEYALDFTTVSTVTSITIENINVKTTEDRPVAKYQYAINGKVVYESTDGGNYTVKGLVKGDKAVNVTALDSNGEIIGSHTRLYRTADVNPPDISKFDKDTTFYVYWDEKGIEHNEIPISKKAPNEWYDYGTANWANIVTRNNGLETYYVWIPRYAYQVDNTNQRTYVRFIKGTGNAEEDAGFKVPEAFWWDNNGNGTVDEGESLTGYWITKYQLTGDEPNRINAEISAGSDLIKINGITGTLIENAQTNSIPLKIEYYLNGDKKYEGESSTEKYEYKGLEENTTYTVNIIVRNSNTNEYIGAVTKKITTITKIVPDTSTFDKETTFYVSWDGDKEVRTSIKENPPENWFNYTNQEWANIVTTANGTETYFVWIPRYEYKTLSNERTDVRFIKKDITNDNCTQGYKVPEAFWWDNNNNGVHDEGEELTGYWMSKYQLSN